jgi:hypothetical protein
MPSDFFAQLQLLAAQAGTLARAVTRWCKR